MKVATSNTRDQVAVGGMVLAIIGAIFFYIPYFGLILCALGSSLSLASLTSLSATSPTGLDWTPDGKKWGMAITGLAIGVPMLALAVWTLVLGHVPDTLDRYRF